MPRFGSFFFGVLVGGLLVFGAQKYHVVRTDKGVELVPKLTSGFGETYVDVRNFKSSDWAQHKTLAAAIVSAKKEYIFNDSAADQVRQGLGGLIDGLRNLREG